MSLAHVASAEDVLDAARLVLGGGFTPPRGVLQTCAIDTDDHVIRVGEHAPKSAWDFFLLHLARASADAIITTGKILRDEPTLRYDLEGAGGIPEALHAYRASIAKKPPRADVVVLTSGRELDLDHPALHGWARPVLALPVGADIARDAQARGIELLELATLSLRSLLAVLSDRACVTIEAGPSTSRALYAAPVALDALWRSRFEGELDVRARGDAFVSTDVIEGALGAAHTETRMREPSGDWTFRRYAR